VDFGARRSSLSRATDAPHLEPLKNWQNIGLV
jgi:hypothetical protein